jgi:hypothetical protein
MASNTPKSNGHETCLREIRDKMDLPKKKQHLKSGSPRRWIEKIQRRFDWHAIVKDSHEAIQNTNMRETREAKMIWMLP